jgi:4-hydroxybenzoate polyprenyltransferase
VQFGRSLRINLVGLLKSTHPIPSFSVTVLVLLFGIGSSLPISTLALVGISVIAQQFSVGLSNDWLDYERDKQVGRRDKPAAIGEVPINAVRNSSLASAAIALVVAGSLGWETTLLMILMLMVGWSYNLGAKATGFSALPYVVGFGILPIYVTLSLDPPQGPTWWIVIAASVLGLGAHFANALPDLLDDKRTGVNALPHILGQRGSAVIIAISAVSASLLIVTQSTNLNATWALVGFVATVGLSVIASYLALQSKPPKLVFHLLIAASFVNVILLMLGQ